MKVAELRSLLENYPDKQLRQIVVALYKAIPKKIREDHLLDDLLKNPGDYLDKNKRSGKKVRIPDMDILELDIVEFVENAYDGNYFAPNRIVPKRERPKWRFKVKRFYKDLTLAASQPENLPKTAELMQKLYEMMCSACSFNLFNAYDVYESVGITQPDFFERVLTLKFQFQEKRDFIQQSILLLIDNSLNRYTLYEDLMEVLISFLKTTDLREMTIQQCRVEIENVRKELAAHPGKKKQSDFFSYDPDKYGLKEKNNNLTILGVLCYFRLAEYDNAIQFFNDNYVEDDKEVALYVLLQLLFTYQLENEWIQVYERAVNSGIKPRKRLGEVYQHIKKSGELPNYM